MSFDIEFAFLVFIKSYDFLRKKDKSFRFFFIKLKFQSTTNQHGVELDIISKC